MSEQHLNDQEIVRREKMQHLKEKGVDPFGRAFKKDAFSKDILTRFESFDKPTLEAVDLSEKTFIVAGRVMTKRVMGKAGFFHLQDQ
jgi:lysyl-tRNA synthetase class 2